MAIPKVVSPHEAAATNHVDSEKNSVNGQDAHEIKEAGTDDSSEYKQEGVQQVEAITTVWSKQLLVVMFILLYLVTFCDSLLESVQGNLVPYITSSFGQHGLLAVTDIVATILGGVCNLTIAKIIDIWGRCEGFVLMVVLVVVGMIMKATCQNVETYAAAQAIYWVGHLGIQYIITIMLADMTTLRNRLILFGLQQTPLIATTFAGPAIAQLFYSQVNFRWAFGAFCIILVAFSIPVALIFVYSKRKAVRLGVFPERPRDRTFWQSCKHYFVEFDVVGMFLTVFGWSLLLLPFSLVGTAPNGWTTGYIIAMIVLGVVLLAAFVVWEKYFATVSYFPFKHLKNPTILGACLLYGIMFTSTFAWDIYYGSYLQVVNGLDITTSGYVLNSFSLMSSFIAPFIGILIRYTGNFKWPAVAAIPVSVLGTALLVYFRTPSTHVGYLVMCQLFNGFATGIWALTAQLAIMACISHQDIAVAIAMYGLFGSIGASIGQAIAGSLWTNILPEKLYEFLPADTKNMTAEIYGDIALQQSYPIGSPIREAIILAYADVMRKMAIVGAAFIPLCLVCVLMWRNINVKKLEETKGNQNKGNVF